MVYSEAWLVRSSQGLSKGFVLKGLKLFQTPEELAQNHYFELKEKPFHPKLVEYFISGPVVCMAWEGPGVVA
jgi:nucleoside-diphosphate kinase